MFFNKFNKMFKLFQNLEETSRFCYYLELRKKYEVEFGAQSSYLAVQVINYLMGFDFNKFYSSVGDEVKIEIDKIKDYIITKADEEMGITEIKEWVDRVLMNKVVLYSSKYDTYTKSKEFANIEILINK